LHKDGLPGLAKIVANELSEDPIAAIENNYRLWTGRIVKSFLDMAGHYFRP
jgi:hypothetical protein